MLTKQHTRMRARAAQPPPPPTQPLSSPTGSTTQTTSTKSTSPADLTVVASCLFMVLDILTIAVTHGLQANPELLYALMYRQEMFARLLEDTELAAQCTNIQVTNGAKIKPATRNQRI